MKLYSFLFASVIVLGLSDSVTATPCAQGDYNVSAVNECIYGKKDEKCDHGENVNPSKTYPTLCFYCQDGYSFNDKDKKCEKSETRTPAKK